MIREEESSSSSEEEGEGISLFLADQVAIVFDVNLNLIPGRLAGWRKALLIEMDQYSQLSLRKRILAAAKKVLATLKRDIAYYYYYERFGSGDSHMKPTKELEEEEEEEESDDDDYDFYGYPIYHDDDAIPIVDGSDDDDTYGGLTQEWLWGFSDDDDDSQATQPYDVSPSPSSSDDTELYDVSSQLFLKPWDPIGANGKKRKRKKEKEKVGVDDLKIINITGPNDLFPALWLHKNINFDDATTACIFGQLHHWDVISSVHSSQSIVVLGKYQNVNMLIKLGLLEPQSMRLGDTAASLIAPLEYERRIYEKFINPLLLQKITPNLRMFIGTVVCSIASLTKAITNVVFKSKLVKLKKAYIKRYRRKPVHAVSLVIEGFKKFEKIHYIVLALNHKVNRDYSTTAKNYATKNMASFLFQILYTLNCLKKMGLKHNDLHLGNVAIEANTKGTLFHTNSIMYVTAGNVKYVINAKNALVKLYDWDLGFSAAVGNNETLDDNPEDGLCMDYGRCNEYLNPNYDVMHVLAQIVRVSGSTLGSAVSAILGWTVFQTLTWVNKWDEYGKATAKEQKHKVKLGLWNEPVDVTTLEEIDAFDPDRLLASAFFDVFRVENNPEVTIRRDMVFFLPNITQRERKATLDLLPTGVVAFARKKTKKFFIMDPIEGRRKRGNGPIQYDGAPTSFKLIDDIENLEWSLEDCERVFVRGKQLGRGVEGVVTSLCVSYTSASGKPELDCNKYVIKTGRSSRNEVKILKLLKNVRSLAGDLATTQYLTSWICHSSSGKKLQNIVMDRWDGSGKDTGKLSLSEFRNKARQLIHSLDAIHGVGVVHFDLREQNFFYKKTGNETLWVVADFGQSRMGATGKMLKWEMDYFMKRYRNKQKKLFDGYDEPFDISSSSSSVHEGNEIKFLEEMLISDKVPVGIPCIWDDIKDLFKKGSLTEKQSTWAADKLIDRLEVKGRRSNITILSLFSGEAHFEARLVARLLERGFHIKNLILVDRIYAKPGEGFKLLVKHRCVDYVYTLTFKGLITMLKNGTIDAIDTIVSVHAWLYFEQFSGRFKDMTETNALFQVVFNNLLKLENLPLWINFRAKEGSIINRIEGPVEIQIESIASKLQNFKYAQILLEGMITGENLQGPIDVMNAFHGRLKTNDSISHAGQLRKGLNASETFKINDFVMFQLAPWFGIGKIKEITKDIMKIRFFNVYVPQIKRKESEDMERSLSNQYIIPLRIGDELIYRSIDGKTQKIVLTKIKGRNKDITQARPEGIVKKSGESWNAENFGRVFPWFVDSYIAMKRLDVKRLKLR